MTPFEAAYSASNNLGSAFDRVRDENSIDRILSDAMGTGDPQVLQNSIGKILSQVSPERQGPAVQYLQNRFNTIQQQAQQSKQEQQQRQAAKEAGYTYGVAPQVAAQQIKDRAKAARLNQYGMGGDVASNGNANPSSAPPNVPNTLPNGQFTLDRFNKDQLIQLTGHPDREIAEPAKAQLKRLDEEEKQNRADIRETRKETLPLRQGFIERANASRESIRNKSHLINLIDKGDINDPTFAIFAESLPFNLGRRMLSDDTVEYKGGLVDEFSDLKNIFKGATRVKEVEIYENKLADLYLDDSQKKAILKSRINTAKIDLIREEAAQKVEEKHPNISALQFNKKVEELAKPEINKLFNQIWDEQKHVIDQAENKKKMPLDPKDPDDLSIMIQIKKEARGDKNRAREIARKKGYSWVGMQ